MSDTNTPPRKCARHPISDLVAVDCQRCGGTGEVDADDFCSYETETCWSCKGTGEAPWLECQWCMDEAADREEDATAKELRHE